ncbi:hypothetical protein SDC9_54725 [bioreactor metagenome]|uniref:Cell wall hydrolase SleB domain-containing protein n=1 Tax=bioreactor metagenome TaxID=1076179 RepID=A0A644X295_9ZZZZ
MRKRKISPFTVAVIIWAICVVGILWFAVKHPRIEYVEVPAEPQIVIVEKEVTTKPYYAEIVETITDEEIELLSRLVYEEARNQSLLGQRAVVSVVLNRVMSDQFPNTVKEVIYDDDPCVQFQPAHKLKDTVPTEEQYQAVRMVLEASEPLLNSKVLYFSTGTNGHTKYEKIGNHYFCY